MQHIDDVKNFGRIMAEMHYVCGWQLEFELLHHQLISAFWNVTLFKKFNPDCFDASSTLLQEDGDWRMTCIWHIIETFT